MHYTEVQYTPAYLVANHNHKVAAQAPDHSGQHLQHRQGALLLICCMLCPAYATCCCCDRPAFAGLRLAMRQHLLHYQQHMPLIGWSELVRRDPIWSCPHTRLAASPSGGLASTAASWQEAAQVRDISSKLRTWHSSRRPDG